MAVAGFSRILIWLHWWVLLHFAGALHGQFVLKTGIIGRMMKAQ